MKLALLAAFACLSLTLACRSDPKPPPRTVDTPMAAAPATPGEPARAAPPPRTPAAAALVVSEDIRKACGIGEPQAYFAYKSAQLRHTDRTVMKQLSQCLTQGPLKNRTTRVVGHTDPRGSQQYNEVLGKSRANSVKGVLVALGVPATRVATESRGKLDATGTNEATWAHDRRVEVLLAN